MAEEEGNGGLINAPNLDTDFGVGGVAGAGGIDPVDPNAIGLNSKTPAMELIEQRKQDSIGQTVIPNSSLPAPTILPGGGMAFPPVPAVDGISKTPIPTANDLAKNFVSNVNAAELPRMAAVDPFKFSKNVELDVHNRKYANQFVDRYKAFDDDIYGELGFSPFRDNESLYNANTTWWDEMGRAGSQWWGLTKLGFMDATGFGGTTDVAAAEQMAESMAIGSSSKEGVGAFGTNLFLNSGYTVGILAELAAEEIAMLGGQALAGLTAPVHGGTANVAIGASMVARGIRAGSKIKKGLKMAANLRKTMSSMKDINVARKVWQTSKNGARGLAKFLNPLENTVDYAQNFRKLDGLSNFAKTSKGFGAMYRDIRNVRLAFGEGSLEGGTVEIEMQGKLRDQFVKENGRQPSIDESLVLAKQAKQAGVTTTLINAPMIMLSNKLTFDGLVRGRMGKLGSDVIETGLGRKILMNPKAELGKVFSVAPAKWKVAARAKMIYQNPKLLAKSVTTYAKANWAEGLQELGQETVAGASQDYYLNQYSGSPVRGGFMAYADSVKKNLGGHAPFETFMSGFLMGGMISPVANTIAATTGQSPTLNNLYLKFANKQEYNKIKAQRDTQLNDTVESLNKLYSSPEKYFSPDLSNLQEQKDMQEDMNIAQKNNDSKTFYDLKNASGAKHIMTALRTGKLDTFVQRMEELKQLSDEEVQQEYGISKAEFTKQMDGGIKQANSMQQMYDVAQRKYSNPFDSSKFKEGTIEHEQESQRKVAWDQSIQQMVTMQESFNNALTRKEKILGDLTTKSWWRANKTGLSKVGASEFASLESLNSLETEIGQLKQEVEGINTLEEVTDPTLKKVENYKKEKIKALEKYRDTVQKNIYEKKDDNEELTSKEYDEIADAFKEYTKLVADEAGDMVDVDALDKAARSSTDAHFLGTRAKKLNAAVNVLLDPKGFVNQVERTNAVNEIIFSQKRNEIKKSLEEFLKLKDTNDMIGEIAQLLEEAGMFADPKAIVELVKTGQMPKELYYISGENADMMQNQVPMTSADYGKAIAIFKNFAEHLHGIAIGEEMSSPYALNIHREKSENDNRSYEDLMKQFLPEGSDLDAASTKVPLVQVLETIAASEYATPQEKALAEKLLEYADRRETVTFVKKQSTPGKFNKNEQSVVDARYSSKEYGDGKGPALETTILKQEVVRRTLESLENNQEFNKQIEALRQQAVDEYNKLTVEDKERLFGTSEKKLPMGFLTNEDFVISSLTDPKFQRLLAMSKTDVANNEVNPVWKKFINSVLEAISKFLGGNINGTVLNATLNLITTNIDSQITKVSQSKKSGKEAPLKKGAKRRGSQMTPAQLMAIDEGKLGEQVVQEFIDENQRRVEDGNNALLPGFDKMSTEEIIKTTAFKNYLKDPNFTRKERLIRNYKDEVQLETGAPEAETNIGQPIEVDEISLEDVTQEEYDNWLNSGVNTLSSNTIYKLAEKVKNRTSITTQEQAMLADTDTMSKINEMLKEMAKPVPTIVNKQMTKQLKALGYKKADIKKLSPARARNYILRGLTAADRVKANTKPSVDQVVQAEVDDFNRTVDDVFDNVNSFDKIITIKNGRKIPTFKNNIRALYNQLSTQAKVKLGDTEALMQRIDAMENQLLERLAFENKFEDLKVGQHIILNNKYETTARISKKTKDSITYEFSKKNKDQIEVVEVVVSAEEISEKIKYRFTPALEELESREAQEDTLTPEDKDQAVGSNENLEKVQGVDDVVDDMEAAKDMSAEEIDDDLYNDLC